MWLAGTIPTGGGRAYLFDGGTWFQRFTTSGALIAASGRSADDVWLLEAGQVFRLRPDAGPIVMSTNGASMNALHAFSNETMSDGGTNFAIVAGFGGAVAVSRDGGSLSPETVPVSALFRAAWGFSADDVWVTGNSQFRARRDLNGWRVVDDGSGGFCGTTAISGAGGTVFFGGFCSNGAPHVTRAPGGVFFFPIAYTGQVNTVAALSANDAWFGLSNGSGGSIWHLDGGLERVEISDAGNVRALFATPSRIWVAYYLQTPQRTEVRAYCR